MSPSSGSGVGYPIDVVASQYIAILGDVQVSLTLDRYQEIMRLPEAAFNGLDRDEDDSCYDCAAVWKQTDRDGLAIAIAQAEEMRERELSYHLSPKYTFNEANDFRQTGIVFLRRKYLINVGVPASEDISLSQLVNLGVETSPYDPVVISVATTVSDADEVCVYHAGENIRIYPTKVVISGGIATIYIPRSRLKRLDLDTNCDPAPSYYDNSNFVTYVDIKRCYIDDTTGAWYVRYDNCGEIGEDTQTAYPVVDNSRLSILKLIPADYASGSWTRTNLSWYPDIFRVSYLSGIVSSIYTEKMTAALAHTLLREIIPGRVSLCDCWNNDILIAENPLDTPYGNANGAVKAWLADSRAKVGQGGKFPRI